MFFSEIRNSVNQQRQAQRQQAIARFIAAHRTQLARQGSLAATWRRRAGRLSGPYFLLVVRDAQGRRRSVYLGTAGRSVDQVQAELAALQASHREDRVFARVKRQFRRALRAARQDLDRHLAAAGLWRKGCEICGWRTMPQPLSAYLLSQVACPASRNHQLDGPLSPAKMDAPSSMNKWTIHRRGIPHAREAKRARAGDEKVKLMKSCFFAVLLALVVTQAARAEDSPKEKVLFEEQFTSELDKDWSWVREDSKAWRIEQGTLVLRTLPGYLHRKRNNSSNVLLRPLPKSDQPLAVEVYMESDPQVLYEHAGLLCHADDDNYVSLWQESPGGKAEATMIIEKAGEVRGYNVKNEFKALWLRMVIAEGKITTQFKPTEQDEWKVVGRSDIPSPGDLRVGIMTGGTPPDVERYTRFQHFRIVEITNTK